MEILSSIGGPLDNLSESAHLVLRELASIPLPKTVMAGVACSKCSVIVSSTSTASGATKLKGKFLNGKRLVFPSLSPPRLPIDA